MFQLFILSVKCQDFDTRLLAIFFSFLHTRFFQVQKAQRNTREHYIPSVYLGQGNAYLHHLVSRINEGKYEVSKYYLLIDDLAAEQM